MCWKYANFFFFSFLFFFLNFHLFEDFRKYMISVNMIDRLDITGEHLMKCDFIFNTVILIDAALNILLRKSWKCNVLLFYLFGQGVSNETKGTINLNGTQIMSIISIRISAVINMMSTSQSINAAPVKTSNGALQLFSLDLAVNNLRQWA